MPVPKKFYKRTLLGLRRQIVNELRREGRTPREIKKALDRYTEMFLEDYGRDPNIKKLYFVNLEGLSEERVAEERKKFDKEVKRWRKLYGSFKRQFLSNPEKFLKEWQKVHKEAQRTINSSIRELEEINILRFNPDVGTYEFILFNPLDVQLYSVDKLATMLKSRMKRAIEIISKYEPELLELYDKHFVAHRMLDELSKSKESFAKLAKRYLDRMDELPKAQWSLFFSIKTKLEEISKNARKYAKKAKQPYLS